MSRTPNTTSPRLASPRQLKMMDSPISFLAISLSMTVPTWYSSRAMITGQTMADMK